MKTLKSFLLLLFGMTLLLSCERTLPPEELAIEEAEPLQLTAAEEQELVRLKRSYFGWRGAKRFKATFFTEQDLTDPRLGVGTGNCEDTSFPFFNVQKGSGGFKRLGTFDAEITFCVKPPQPGETEIDYKDGEGTLALADGHKIYIQIPTGVVKLIIPPTEYQAEFQDIFYITGGTGPYENARGIGITNSKVQFFPTGGDRTDHTWLGIMSLDED